MNLVASTYFRLMASLPRARLLLLILLAVSLTCVARAQQQDKGVIVGTVTDATGAVIPNAAVTVNNRATGAIYNLTTNSVGFYTTAPLQIGAYEVTVTKPGFQTSTEAGIVIDVDTRAQIDFRLHTGSFQVEVTVKADSPALNTTSATLGMVIDQRTLEDLPLNGGNALALAALVPGVTSAFGATSSGFNDRGTQLSSIRIGGGAVGANAYTLDASNNELNYLGEVAINPQVDSIAQFRLINGAAPAQFGFTSGGIIDIASRGGSNSLHGTLYEFWRNDILDAQNFFSSPVLHKPELRYNRFGGSIGGKLIRNKLFYFANTEFYDLVQTNPTYATVPTPLERMGNFSLSMVDSTGVCTPVNIYNPTTHVQYPNNTLPSINTTANTIQQLFYPLPNNTLGPYDSCSHSNNYVSNARTVSSQQLGLGRIDYQIASRDGIFVRYAIYQNATNNAGTLPNLTASARNDGTVNQDLTLGYTRVISANSLNDLRISGLRAAFPFLAGSYNQNWAAQLGIANLPITTLPSLSNGEPAFNTVTGFRATTQIQVTDNLTHQFGTHGTAIGFDLRFGQAYNGQNPAPDGIFTFLANTTGTTNVSSTTPGNGDIYATFLLGAVNSAEAFVVNGTTFRSSSISGYVQDDWRLLRNLTLNLGLRYDYQQQPYEIDNKTSNFDINRTDPVNGYYGETVYAGLGGYGRTFNQSNYTNFSPRFGFALNLPRFKQAVLRGGYAMYYSSIANASFAGATTGFGTTTTTYSATTNNGVALTLNSGFPSPPTQNLGSALGPAAFLGTGAVSYQESYQPVPMSQVFTLTVSKQLPGQIVAEVSYLGNRGIHFVEPNYNLDQLNPIYYSLGTGAIDQLQQAVPNPYSGQIPGSFGGASITRFYLLRPYPYYASVGDYQPRHGNYFGNYMYASAQRRVGKGVQLISSYTLGKLFSDPIYVPLSTVGGVTTSPSSSFQNPYNRRAEYTIDPLDVTHRLTTSAVYALPFGPNQRFLNKKGKLSSIVGNWTVTTIFTFQTGSPIAIAGANNYGIATRPSFSGVSPLSNCPSAHSHTIKCWFNPAAFVNPFNYTFGTVPRAISQLRGPGADNLDASVLKNFKLAGRYSVQLRFEGFNVTNHPNFNLPNASFASNPYCDYTAAPNTTPCPAATPLPNTNSLFGQINSAAPARIFQIAAKVTF